MAKTKVVNKKRRKSKAKRRRRNYGAAASNPKRKRRRNPGTAMAPRRRSNTRRKNPGVFDFDNVIDTVPAATGGVWLGRWATKMAGSFTPDAQGVLEPGFKHAIAIWLAASVGGDVIGNMLGSAQKGEYARIACLGYGGDLFMRLRFMRDSEFVERNLSLAGLGAEDPDDVYDYDDDDDDLDGFSDDSPLGNVNTYTDAVGNEYAMTARGWKLAGDLGQDDLMVGPDGTLYQMDGVGGLQGVGTMGAGTYQYPADYAGVMEDSRQVGGFSNQSAIGMAPVRPDSNNSFGYA